MTLATVYIHADPAFSPGQCLAVLTTAHEVERTFGLMQPGNASCSVARNDPALTQDLLRMGNYLVIKEPNTPTWVGPIGQPSETLDGLIKVSASEHPALLEGVPTDQTTVFSTSVGSGQVFASILRTANRQRPTGIRLPALVPSGPSVEDFTLGGQGALSALNELALASNWEWAPDYQVNPWGVQTTLLWSYKQGQDVSDRVHLYEGVHFVESEHSQDATAVKAAVTTIGGTGTVGERTATTVKPDERQRRALLPYGTVATYRVNLDPTTSNKSELNQRGGRDIDNSIRSVEQWDIVVNELAPVADLLVGNYVTLHQRTSLPGSTTRVVRIKTLTPRNGTGTRQLAVEQAVR